MILKYILTYLSQVKDFQTHRQTPRLHFRLSNFLQIVKKKKKSKFLLSTRVFQYTKGMPVLLADK